MKRKGWKHMRKLDDLFNLGWRVCRSQLKRFARATAGVALRDLHDDKLSTQGGLSLG